MKEQKEFMPFLDLHNWEQTVLESPRSLACGLCWNFLVPLRPLVAIFLCVGVISIFFHQDGVRETDRDRWCLSVCLSACLSLVGRNGLTRVGSRALVHRELTKA